MMLKISKRTLARQYETMRPKEIADLYGICLARLYKLLDESEIPRKRKRRLKRDIPKIVLED